MKRKVVRMAAVVCGLLWLAAPGLSQNGPGSSSSESVSSTSNDLFIMLGSDFVRPGLETRANYNIGLGHTFEASKKDPFGDEVTFGYTYENAGSHGFFHTAYGSHTEALGLMKNFAVPHTKILTGYTSGIHPVIKVARPTHDELRDAGELKSVGLAEKGLFGEKVR